MKTGPAKAALESSPTDFISLRLWNRLSTPPLHPLNVSSDTTIEMLEELPPYDPSSPLPSYFASSGPSSPMDTISFLSTGSLVEEYNYKSDHLRISLGPRRWGTKFPVYGLQGVVEGTVRVAKKCTHVVSVSVTVSLLWFRSSYCRPPG